jgi:hypothetical protein
MNALNFKAVVAIAMTDDRDLEFKFSKTRLVSLSRSAWCHR